MTVNIFSVEVGKQDNEGTVLTALNEKSYLPRLGLARALARSADAQKQARHLYREVIDMAPEVRFLQGKRDYHAMMLISHHNSAVHYSVHFDSKF